MSRVKESTFSKSAEEHENDELWAISYGDMITLLLSFFVIFYSTDFNKAKYDQTDDHLIKSFNLIKTQASSNGNSIQKENDKSIGRDQKKAQIEKMSKLNGVDKNETKFEYLQNARIAKLDQVMLVTFDKMNFFKTAEVDPNAEGQKALVEFANKYLPYAGMYKLSIKAFTDNRPVMSIHRYKDNMELSALRAIAALRILQKAGIPLNRMEVQGYGEMNKLNTLIDEKIIKQLTLGEIRDISRTIVLIIKHENEKSVL